MISFSTLVPCSRSAECVHHIPVFRSRILALAISHIYIKTCFSAPRHHFHQPLFLQWRPQSHLDLLPPGMRDWPRPTKKSMRTMTILTSMKTPSQLRPPSQQQQQQQQLLHLSRSKCQQRDTVFTGTRERRADPTATRCHEAIPMNPSITTGPYLSLHPAPSPTVAGVPIRALISRPSTCAWRDGLKSLPRSSS